tara:strand:- start:118 stop:696 length:579 start_codon:yes stop_codon:yes gene_type:complete
MNNFYSHKSAIIDDNVKIGDNTKIWHFSHISKGAVIGADCIIGQNVFIGNNVKIGNKVKIQNNVSVYEGVILEDECFCGPSVVFTNVTNPRSWINKKNDFKETIVRRGSTIGANSTIICSNSIGEYSFIGAGSVVTKEVKNNSLVYGNPAKQIGWITKEGNKIPLPLIGSGKYQCKISHDTYYLKNDNLIIE